MALRYKILAWLTLLLGAVTISYFSLAIRLFDTDKTVYVMDTVTSLAETLGEETAASLTGTLKTLRLMTVTLMRRDNQREQEIKKVWNGFVGDLFNDDENLVGVRVYRVNSERSQFALNEANDANLKEQVTSPSLKQIFRSDKIEFLEKQHIDVNLYDKIEKQFPPSLPRIIAGEIHIQNVMIDQLPPFLVMSMGIKEESDSYPKYLAMGILRQDQRLLLYHRSELYSSYLVDSLGHYIVHSKFDKLKVSQTTENIPKVQEVISSQLNKGAFEYLDEAGQKNIVAFKRLGQLGLVAFSEIPRNAAFMASTRLMERSALFGILILSISVMLSVVLSKRLTSALQNLYLATRRIAQGDFSREVPVTGNDEVGALSESFNIMQREVNRLLEETADKVRMEKELETAQIVQESFFPKEDFIVGDLAVSGYFSPANECGGDFWGSIARHGKLLILVGDGTGHGVPAALMTAVAHSCTTTIAHLAEFMPGWDMSPKRVLEALNIAITRAGQGRVKMTFFCLEIELESGQIRYANASHDAPILGRLDKNGAITKQSLDILGGHPNPCLGEDFSTVFLDYESQLLPGETILLYTDGLIEGKNSGGEEYGERRMLRDFLVKANDEPSVVKKHLLAKVDDFAQSRHRDDDVTLIVIKRLERKLSEIVAMNAVPLAS